MVMAMQHGLLPQTLHVKDPSSHVDWSGGEVRLLTEPAPWGEEGRTRRAAVSSFGISGTNAHVILEQAPTAELATDIETVSRNESAQEVLPWVVSAKTEEGLKSQAELLLALAAADAGPGQVGWALATTRTHFENRAAIVGSSLDDFRTGLTALRDGQTVTNLVTGIARDGKTAFMFTGQGAQRPTMGRELYGAFPVFADALDEACGYLSSELGRPLQDIMWDEDGELLHQTGYAQPAIFALETALYRLLRHWGIEPSYLIGHSIGEITAAHVSGVLSLQDAAVLVGARARLMQGLAIPGAMVAVEATEDAVIAYLTNDVSLAAVNGRRSVVISGQEAKVLDLAAKLEQHGHKTRRLVVSNAFHSACMDSILDEFRAIAAGLNYNDPTIPIISNVTGVIADSDELCSPDYWVEHLRRTVRFHEGVGTLLSLGATNFVEIGPDATLSSFVKQADPAAAVVPLLRKMQSEVKTVITAVAEVHTHGATVDWTAIYPAAGEINLPTYPFQHKTYWIDCSPETNSRTGHPLISASVELLDGGVVHQGQISTRQQSWLLDHMVHGRIVVPGTTWVELACWAGRQIGCDEVAELTHHSPLALSEGISAKLQLHIQEADGSDQREFTLRCRKDKVPGSSWIVLARGILRSSSYAPEMNAEMASATWPPEGSWPIDSGDYYPGAARKGFYNWGPAFHSLREVWRRGEEIFAEIRYADSLDSGAFDLHPALFDAAMHAIGVDGVPDSLSGMIADEGTDAARPRIPFLWRGVTIKAQGRRALRVRIVKSGEEGISITLFDDSGQVLGIIRGVVLLPVSFEQLRSAAGVDQIDSLYEITWSTAPTASPHADWPSSWVGIAAEELAFSGHIYESMSALVADVRGGSDIPDLVLVQCDGGVRDGRDAGTAAGSTVASVLTAIQDWLSEPALTQCRLVLVTRGMSVRLDAAAGNPAQSAVWGLVRSAQSEHPDRIVLVDVDDEDESLQVLPGFLHEDVLEPQFVIRRGQRLVPRLARVRTTSDELASFDPEGTVLITGGTGALGAQVARHLVERYSVRRLVLASRRGPRAEGAVELESDLKRLGADVEILTCDVSDRDSLATMLRNVTSRHRLTALVHAAGVIDDAVISELSPSRIETVFGPKASAAWHLHELTQELTLAKFILFSAAAGTLGSPGQGNYSAANAFLDGLACYRRELGLPAISLAWGLWKARSGITGDLSDVDHERIARQGATALSTEHGLALFDAALSCDSPCLVPLGIDETRLGDAATLSPVLRSLAEKSLNDNALRQPLDHDRSSAIDLRAKTGREREQAVNELVISNIAAVIGRPGHLIGFDAPFREIGLDSLMAIELRNRLSNVTGLPLASTFAFDHPTAQAVSRYLCIVLDSATPDGGIVLPGGENPVGSAFDEIDSMDDEALIQLAHESPMSEGY
ncbi:SDR family NAD(P)-dependent oxidoreductase [Nocardia sp. NPDC005745]|uniref:type I polyketide synthase n=1 Tax=Nocardia sp. NPDC005745 TaxID=3157061 RepID=UPI0033C898C2